MNALKDIQGVIFDYGGTIDTIASLGGSIVGQVCGTSDSGG